LDLRVSKVDPAWPVTATLPEVPSVKPATTIHVNPKFLTQVGFKLASLLVFGLIF